MNMSMPMPGVFPPGPVPVSQFPYVNVGSPERPQYVKVSAFVWARVGSVQAEKARFDDRAMRKIEEGVAP